MTSSRSSKADHTTDRRPDQPDEGSFLSRWSRRKAAVREGRAVAPEPAVAPRPPAGAAPHGVPAAVPAAASAEAAEAADAADAAPAPTLADVALLKPGESIERFVARGVDEQVKRAALKTLFADPHFNVMDGLDIYIDDYTKPDPIPPEVLRRLTQSETLGLFDPIEDDTHGPGNAAAQQDTGAAEDEALAQHASAEPVDATPSDESGGIAQADAGDGKAPLAALPGQDMAPAPALSDPDKPA